MADVEEWARLGPHRFLEDAPSGVVVVHQDGRIAWANRAAVRIFGYSRGEMVGQMVDMLVPTARRTEHTAHLANWVRHPTARPMGASLGIQGQNKNGELLDLDIQLSPLETDTGVMGLAWVLERA